MRQPDAGVAAEALVGVRVLPHHTELAEKIGIDVEDARLGEGRADVELQLLQALDADLRDGAIHPEPLAFSEQVAMSPIGLHLHAIDGRSGDGSAEKARLALGHLDRDGDAAAVVGMLAFDHAHAFDALEFTQTIARVFQISRIEPLTRLERGLVGNALGIEIDRSRHVDPTVNGGLPRLDDEANVDHRALVVRNNVFLGDLSKRVADAAPRLDQLVGRSEHECRLRRLARDQRVVSRLGRRGRLRRRTLLDGDGAKPKDRARLDAHDHRNGRAGLRFYLRWPHLLEADTPDRDFHIGAVVRLRIESGDQTLHVATCASGESESVGRAFIGLRYEKRRLRKHRLKHSVVPLDVEGYGIGQVAVLRGPVVEDGNAKDLQGGRLKQRERRHGDDGSQQTGQLAGTRQRLAFVLRCCSVGTHTREPKTPLVACRRDQCRQRGQHGHAAQFESDAVSLNNTTTDDK